VKVAKAETREGSRRMGMTWADARYAVIAMKTTAKRPTKDVTLVTRVGTIGKGRDR
jgi:phage FluMu gp28-like protein